MTARRRVRQRLSPAFSPVAGPAKRVQDYLRTVRLMIGDTRDQVYETRTQLKDLEGLLRHEIASRAVQFADQTEQTEASARSREAEHWQIVEILRWVYDQGQASRDGLRAIRADAAYARAYSDANPLVSVVIPTYDNHRLLRERAIPSVLAQSYQNLEIVVVGDAAPDAARLAAESFGDPRISFCNLPFRGPYPEDPETRWLVAGVPPYNEAVRRSRGLWICPLDDDDAFRPQHVERLLERAREERLELAYAQQCAHWNGGVTTTIGRFPPQIGQFGLQSALYHAGLADSFVLDLADAALGLPYDWALCRRMLSAGVRVGMLEEETIDYYPSKVWTPGRYGIHNDQGHGTEADSRTAQPDPSADAPEWEYVPEGWDRARRPDEQSTLGWRAAGVARSYREKWPQFLEALEGSGPLGVAHEVPQGASMDRTDVLAQSAVLAYAYALSRAAGSSKKVSLLDWGGALGHYYVLAARLRPDLELDYHCRELPAVCAEGRQVLPEATFHDTDDCLERRYDLVLASSSLQYEQDWSRLLRRLSEASRSWTFLNRVPLARRSASFVVLQRAHAYGYATEYLGWVLGRHDLLDAAGAAGLELVREFVLRGDRSIARAPDNISEAGFLFRAFGGPP